MDQLPPIQELLLIEKLEEALKKLLLPPLIDCVVDYLLGPPASRPRTRLQLSYNKTTREVDLLLHKEAEAFFHRQQDGSITEYHELGKWMRLNEFNAQTAAENLRFSIRDFAFTDNLPHNVNHTFPSSPGSVLSFHNGKRNWDAGSYSAAFRTFLEDPHLADLAIEIGLAKLTLVEMIQIIPFSVNSPSFYEMHSNLHQPLWTADAFVDFLFARVPQIMTTHWAFTIVTQLDQWASKEFAGTFIRRLPTIDWTKCDPVFKMLIKAFIGDPETHDCKLLRDFCHNLLQQL
jgi:hypothetical protein